MKRLDFRSLAVGCLVGGAAMLLLGQTADTPTRPFASLSVEKVLFPRRQEGVRIVGSGTTLAPRRTDAEDLLPLVDVAETQENRYQALMLGSDGDFMVLDSRTGVARAFRTVELENGQRQVQRVELYNAKVPNHIIEAPVRRHTDLVD
ncbi:MAG: hypothetical protein KF858_00480 [Candidatus Sumerlaeia bacterium]|nr:hypothetical protein [Candidatus Sumerlaeia bacterium]